MFYVISKDERCENGSEEFITAVGRNFIPNQPKLYTCVFVAFGDSDKPVVYKNVGFAGGENRLKCMVRALNLVCSCSHFVTR